LALHIFFAFVGAGNFFAFVGAGNIGRKRREIKKYLR
jgi:hypothetical protein